MKLETYEKAVEIRGEISKLVDLESLISNAAHQNNELAALRPLSFSNLDEDRIMNAEPLSLEMRDAFLQIIHTKMKELRDEFESL
jgi:hypothetical protein